MTEVLFSINNAGKMISARYYTITWETMEKKILSEELIDEVIRRVIKRDCTDQIETSEPCIPGGDSITECFVKPQHSDANDWNFTFENMQVKILKKYDYKVEFFVSRDIPKWNNALIRIN
jgi:hypothetical protein